MNPIAVPPSTVPSPDAPSWADTLIHSRRTTLPKRLCGPGPDGTQRNAILAAAAAAPDHGQLLPWRFIEVPDTQRDRLATAFADALLARDPA
ncbi:nitroreductase family protein, partial [Hydrogenophaga atypica]